jgi:mannose-6-phosphate isomerase-like protein (cupin superfamily)
MATTRSRRPPPAGRCERVADRTLKITPGETVTVRRSDAELLQVEGAWAPSGKPPPKHYHPSQAEHFEVLEGRLRTRVDDVDRDLGPGETLDVPAGVVHQMWNPGSEPTRAVWQVRPAGRTLEFFEDIDALYREGKVGKNGIPGPLAFGVLLTEYDDVFRLAVPAEPVVRGGLSALAVVGRARGYSAGR